MNSVPMYTTDASPSCRRAEALLTTGGVTRIERINVDQNSDARRVTIRRTGRRSAPQTLLCDRPVGSVDELLGADSRGERVLWLDECTAVTAEGA